jgi:hypothetical protein
MHAKQKKQGKGGQEEKKIGSAAGQGRGRGGGLTWNISDGVAFATETGDQNLVLRARYTRHSTK